MNKRDLKKEYQARKQSGGVYRISNTVNGKYLIGYAVNLARVKNRFQFTVTTGSIVDPRVKDDWALLGSNAFALEVLEELEQEPDQSQAEFLDDLKMLEQLCRAQFDPSKEY